MPLPCCLLLLPLLWGVVLCRLLDALPLGMLLLLFRLLLGMLLLLFRLLLGMLLWLFRLLLGMLLWLLLFRLLLGMLLWLLLFRLLLGVLLWLLLFRLLLSMLLWLLLFLLWLRMLLWLRLRMLLWLRLSMLLRLLLFWLGSPLSLLCKGRNSGSERQEQDCCSETYKCFHGYYLYTSVNAGAANRCILLTTASWAQVGPRWTNSACGKTPSSVRRLWG
jgi:hypothetical protein